VQLLILGYWALGIGHGALGMGHWALGMGHWALGMGHWAWALGMAQESINKNSFSSPAPPAPVPLHLLNQGVGHEQ
jgi:hypothetical protein